MTPRVLTGADATVAEVEAESFEPRDERHRYRIYELAPCETCGGTGNYPLPTRQICRDCRGKREMLRLLCTTPTKEGVGTAIVTLGEDAHEAGRTPPGPIGVLDGVEARWLALPWPRKEP